MEGKRKGKKEQKTRKKVEGKGKTTKKIVLFLLFLNNIRNSF